MRLCDKLEYLPPQFETASCAIDLDETATIKKSCLIDSVQNGKQTQTDYQLE